MGFSSATYDSKESGWHREGERGVRCKDGRIKENNEGVGNARPEGCAASQVKSGIRGKRETTLKVSAAVSSSRQEVHTGSTSRGISPSRPALTQSRPPKHALPTIPIKKYFMWRREISAYILPLSFIHVDRETNDPVVVCEI